MQARIEPFGNRQRVEVAFPQTLEGKLVGIEQIVRQPLGRSVGKAFENDLADLVQIVGITVAPFQIINEPSLVGEAITEITDSERQRIALGRYGSLIGTIGHLAQAGELNQMVRLAGNRAGDVVHGEHVRVGEVGRLPFRRIEYLTHIAQQ